MRTFTEFINENKSKSGKVTTKKYRYDNLKNSILNRFDVKHESELSESEYSAFQKELSNQWLIIKERNNTYYDVNEKKINSESELRSYAEEVLRNAHGDKYNQEIVNKMVTDLIDKYGDDWGAMIGALQSGLAEEYQPTKESFYFENGMKIYNTNVYARNVHTLVKKADRELLESLTDGEAVRTSNGFVFDSHIISEAL